MKQQEYFNKVKYILNDLGYTGVEMNSNLKQDLGLDSLDVVEAIMKIETECNIMIADDRAEKIKTVKDIVCYLEDKI